MSEIRHNERPPSADELIIADQAPARMRQLKGGAALAVMFGAPFGSIAIAQNVDERFVALAQVGVWGAALASAFVMMKQMSKADEAWDAVAEAEEREQREAEIPSHDSR